MKNNHLSIRGDNLSWVFFLSCLCFLQSSNIYSQDIEDIADKQEVNLGIEYYQNYDNTKSVIVTLSRRENRVIKYLKDVSITIYLNDTSQNSALGNITTGEDGKGKLLIDIDEFEIAKGSSSEFNLIASLNNSEKYTCDETFLKIIDTKLNIQCFEEDSIKYIKATFSYVDSMKKLFPIEDIEVHFYVQRMLSLLPIGGDYTYTGENGEISIEFPNDLPGNRQGNLDIFVKIEDEENYGNLTSKISKEWGIPLVFDDKLNKRALWASRANAPILLIIIANLIILGVWVIIVYLALQLFKIRKLS